MDASACERSKSAAAADASGLGPRARDRARQGSPPIELALSLMMRDADLRTLTLTLITLVAFASNSLLTRLALGGREIDPASFTALRLGSGAVVLALLVRVQTGTWRSWVVGGPLGPLTLFVYAVPFSFAYVRIGAAVGALVLFGAVQLTMIGYGLVRGERPGLATWVGLAIAVAGFGILAAPAATARPDLVGVALMACAGVAWGVYSLAGRTGGNPLAVNARSFLWSSPPAIAVMLLLGTPATITARGLILVTVCGAVTSGLGYAIWYRALRRLSVTQASVAQLGVPAIAALGAVLLLDEPMTMRLIVAGSAVLGGVALVLLTRSDR